jgi:hypothetical protein
LRGCRHNGFCKNFLIEFLFHCSRHFSSRNALIRNRLDGDVTNGFFEIRYFSEERVNQKREP